jgi:hypothetical protein
MASALSHSSENFFVPLYEDDSLPPSFEELLRMAKKMADGGKVTQHEGSKEGYAMLTFNQGGKYKRLIVKPLSPEPTIKAPFKAVATSIEDSLAVAYAKGRNAAGWPSDLRRTVDGHPVVVDLDMEGTKFAEFYRVSLE